MHGPHPLCQAVYSGCIHYHRDLCSRPGLLLHSTGQLGQSLPLQPSVVSTALRWLMSGVGLLTRWWPGAMLVP